MGTNRASTHRQAVRHGSAAGRMSIRSALIALGGAALVVAAVGVSKPAHAGPAASGHTYTWVDTVASANWSNSANWSCAQNTQSAPACPTAALADPVDDQASDVVLPAGGGLTTLTTVDQSLTVSSLSIDDAYTLQIPSPTITSLSVIASGAIAVAGSIGEPAIQPTVTPLGDMSISLGSDLGLNGRGFANSAHTVSLTGSHSLIVNPINQQDTPLLSFDVGSGATLTMGHSVGSVTLHDSTLAPHVDLMVNGTLTGNGSSAVAAGQAPSAAPTITATAIAPVGTITLHTGSIGVTLVGPLPVDTSPATLGSFAVEGGSSLQTGETDAFTGLTSLTLAGDGPSGSPGALVVNTGTLTVGSLTASASFSLNTGAHILLDLGGINDAAVTVTKKGGGALETGTLSLTQTAVHVAGGSLAYDGKVANVALDGGTVLGNNHTGEAIQVGGTLRLNGDAGIGLVDQPFVPAAQNNGTPIPASLATLTLSGSPILADDGSAHTVTLLGQNGGELIADGATGGSFKGTIAVQAGAAMHASGAFTGLSVAGTGDPLVDGSNAPLATPADALHLDGDLGVATLGAGASAGIDLGGHQLSAAGLTNPSPGTIVTLNGTGTALLDSGTASVAGSLSLVEGTANTIQAAGDVTLGSVTLPASGILDAGHGNHVVLTGSLVLTGNGAQVQGDGGSVTVDSGLQDGGHSLDVDGLGSGATLALQGTNTSDGSAAPSGSVDVSPANRLTSASALHLVQLDGGSVEATSTFTLTELRPRASSKVTVDGSNTLTVTTLDDALSGATLTLAGNGTTAITNDPALANLDLAVTQAGSLDAMGSVHAVTLSSGATLAATGGDLTLHGQLSTSAAVPSNPNPVQLAGGDRTITLSGGLADAGRTVELVAPGAGTHGVTVKVANLNLSTLLLRVDPGSLLQASGSAGALTIGGQGPSGTGHALEVTGGTLTVTGAFTVTPPGASVGVPSAHAPDLRLDDSVDSGSAAVLTLDGAGTTRLAAPTGVSLSNLDVTVVGGGTLLTGGSLHSVSLGASSTLASFTTSTPSTPTVATLTGVLTLTGDAALGGNAVAVTGSNGLADGGHTLNVDAGVFAEIDHANTSTGVITVPSTSTLKAAGSLGEVDIAGAGGSFVTPVTSTSAALLGSGSGLSVGDLELTGDATVEADGTGTGALVVSTLEDPAHTLTLIGNGTMAVANPNLSNLAIIAGNGSATPTLRTTGSTHALLGSVTLGAGAVLDDESGIQLAVSHLILGGNAAVTGTGTTAVVGLLSAGSDTLALTTPGSTPPGVTVTVDGASVSGSGGVSVSRGSSLVATGSIANLAIAGAGPSGAGHALVVDSAGGISTLSVASLTLTSNAAVLVDPGRALTVSGTVTNSGPSDLKLDGPGALAGPSSVTLPATASFGTLEVGGGVVVNAGTISASQAVLHGDSTLQPSALLVSGTPAIVVPDATTITPAQIGLGSGASTMSRPSAGTIGVTVNSGGWLYVPAQIIDSSGAVGLTVDPLAGVGTLQLLANNSYTGSTAVLTGATLLVDGFQPQSDVTLLGGTLGGSGEVGRIAATDARGGAVAPTATHVLTAAGHVNLVDASGGVDTYHVTIGGSPQSELLAQLGATISSGQNAATLVVTAGNSSPAVGQTFTILSSTNAPPGHFANLPDGAELFSNDQAPQRFRINYPSNGDVVLTYLGRVPTTVAVTADHNPQTYGSPVVFTATVTGTDNQVASAITGGVTFFDGTTPLDGSPIPVSGGAAHLPATTALSVGQHSITAQYTGDGTYLGATSPAFTQTINPLASAMTTVTSVPLDSHGHNAAPSGTSITFSTTVTSGASPLSGGTVSFFDGQNQLGQPAAVSGGLAQVSTATLGVGIHAITATYSGDSTHAGATTASALTQHVTAPTTTSLTSSRNPAPSGTAISLRAAVTSLTAGTPSGTVDFFDGAAKLNGSPVALDGSGVATFVPSPALASGSHPLTATYSSDDTFSPSTSSPLTQYVTAATTTAVASAPTTVDSDDLTGTVVTSDGDSVAASGSAVTFTATVTGTGPTGMVTFFDGPTQLGSGAVSGGTATLTTATLAIGVHPITAQYGGDNANSPSTSSPALTQHITAPTQTAIATSQTTVPPNSQIIFTGHVTSSTPGSLSGSADCLENDVRFGGARVDSGGNASCQTPPVTPGVHRYGIGYLGNDSDTPSVSSDLFVMTPKTVALATTAAQSTDQVASDFVSPQTAPITFTVTIAGSTPAPPTGTVQFLDGGQPLGTVAVTPPASGNVSTAQISTSLLSPGLHVVTAQYSGDANNGAGTSNAIDQYITRPTNSTFSVSTDPVSVSRTGTLSFSFTLTNPPNPTGAPLPTGTFDLIDVTGSAAPLTGPSSPNQLAPATLLSDGTASLSGVAWPSALIGPRTIEAVYSGDNVWSPSVARGARAPFTNSSFVIEHLTVDTLTTVAVTTLPSETPPQVQPLVGQPITFTATLTQVTPSAPKMTAAPAAPMELFDNGTLMGRGVRQPATTAGVWTWTLTSSSLGPGLHTITAAFDTDTSDPAHPDLNWSSSTNAAQAPAVVQDVQAPSTTVLASSANPAVSDAPFTLTATVTGTAPVAAGGTVDFKDGSTDLGTATVTGGTAHRTVSLHTIGAHTLTAVYTGDPSYSPGTSGPLTQTILIPTTTSITTSRSPQNQNAPVTFTVTVTSGSGTPTGSVTVIDGTAPIGSAPVTAGGVATVTTSTLGAGVHSISAAFTGTGLFGPSTGSVQQSIVPPNQGYWLVAADGGIFPFGAAQGLGSTGGIHLNRPIVGMASTPDGGGYWLVASDGGIFPFGDAVGFGSTGGIHLNQPIVGMASTPDGGGYWLVASDGGIFPFGDASGFGSTGGIHLNQPIVGMASTPDGGGYWLVASDGGIFPFGDASGFGSTGAIRLNRPIVALAATPDGGGYWLVASDGGIFPFGDAAGLGSTGGARLNQPIVGMTPTPSGRGYWLVASDGGIFPFGDAAGLGSTGGTRLNQPIVQMAAPPRGFHSLPG